VTSKKGLQVFFCKRWAPFFKSNNVERHFYRDFQGFCPDLQRFALIFDKSKLFWRALGPPAPTPLFQWLIKLPLSKLKKTEIVVAASL